MVVVTAIAAVLFVAGAFVSYRARGLSWVTIVFFGLVAFGIAGIIDALTQRIELHDDRLVIVRNLRRREYPRAMFVKAQWSKGVPVSPDGGGRMGASSRRWGQQPGARQHADAIDRAMTEMRTRLPTVGSYVAESNFFEPAWQESFWGSNYARLLAVKDKYDPDGLFVVHHGVGSERWSADGFTRLAGR